MILVDTTVVSEPLRRAPEPRVAEWLAAQVPEMLNLSAITVAELRFGVWSLPAGRRRDRLHGDLEERVLPMFAGRVLPFDPAASQACAEPMAKPRSGGRSIAVSDGYIAATAAANGMMVATRGHRAVRGGGIEDRRSVGGTGNDRCAHGPASQNSFEHTPGATWLHLRPLGYAMA